MLAVQAEEFNRFREQDVGRHYGYPYCWTEYLLSDPFGNGTGTVWAWPDFILDQKVTDEQCRIDFIPPIVSMQAHSAPLGVAFYKWTADTPLECLAVQPFPKWMDGYAFIAYHGSWNRDVPTGYKVVYIAMDGNGEAVSSPVDLLAHQPPDANWEDGFRPVDVAFDACGRLIVTSDGTGDSGSKIVRIEWIGLEREEPSGAPSVVTDAPTNSSHAPTHEASSSMSPLSSQTQGSELPSYATGSVPSPLPFVEPSSVPFDLVSATSSPSTSASSTRGVSTILLLLSSMSVLGLFVSLCETVALVENESLYHLEH